MTEDVLFATQDVPYFVRYDAVDNDPTTDVISWDIRTDAHWLAVNNSNATLLGIPTNSDVGTYWVNVTVMDDRNGYNWSNFTLTVLNVNDPPTILTGIIPDSVQNIAYSFFLSGEDIDPTEDLLTWSMSTDASWIDLDPGTGELFGTPDNDDVGIHRLNITLDDGNGGIDVLNTTITVHNVNDDPIISTIPREYVYQDEEYVQSFEFFDIDPTDDILSVYFDTNASFLFYEASIYTVRGTPTNDDVGEYWINFTVKDDKGGIGILNYTLTVLNVNDPPVIMTRNVKVAAQDVEYRVRYEAYDPDGDDLLWSLDTDSTFLSMDPLTGILSGTPSNDDVGLWNVNVSVSDGVLSAYSDFVLEVLNVNDPPHVIDPHLVIEMDEDTELILDLNTIFGDIDGDPLLYSVRPSDNISFDVSENTLSIVPNPNWSGSEYIHVEAFDGQYRCNGSFLLIVNNVNDPPYDLVVEYNESYAEGSPQIARASAKDPDLPYGDTLNFTWKADGVAIGYGPEIDLGLPPGSYLINVTVRDGSGQSIHHEFEIEVTSQSNGKELPYLALILIALFIILAAIGILIFMRRSKTDPDPGVDLSDRDDMTNEGMNGDPPVLEEDGSKDLTEDEALPVPESTIPEEAPETSEQVPEVMPMEDVSPELIEPYDDHTPP